MKISSIFASIGILISFLTCSARSELLEVGKEVPAASAVDSENKEVKLKDLLSKGTTLVFFYPKANTGG